LTNSCGTGECVFISPRSELYLTSQKSFAASTHFSPFTVSQSIFRSTDSLRESEAPHPHPAAESPSSTFSLTPLRL
jgi:hypothetical protein